VASRDNLDRLYRDASNSLTILERSHRFTMVDLDHYRHELQVSQVRSSVLGSWKGRSFPMECLKSLQF
jgi:hypothetical protein